MKKITSILLLALFLSGCTVLEEYEKMNLNDPDMALSDLKLDKNLSTFHSYREAASGGNGGKTGGGCGCN
ncbi:DUF4266 domain-containing protein [Sanyastnella coralliicola]|uniref:DUF4266 domain-containing protein n=1 Tax=Sanyastnella coralliicola TaxID=3069118 RepID=UPI0027BAF862|nr:DUF4266 domain-containing protein [Longitalea sp. SCSIO 12813]